ARFIGTFHRLVLRSLRENYFKETIEPRCGHMLENVEGLCHGVSQSYKITCPTVVAVKTFQARCSEDGGHEYIDPRTKKVAAI
ncbi:unnamed protein product, partial [Prorocentrum cordatum]